MKTHDSLLIIAQAAIKVPNRKYCVSMWHVAYLSLKVKSVTSVHIPWITPTYSLLCTTDLD